MNSTRRGFLGMLGIGAIAVAAPSISAASKRPSTASGVELRHERNAKKPAAWMCRGVHRERGFTFAVDLEYTDDDLQRLGADRLRGDAERFVTAALTGPDRAFFAVTGSGKPRRRAGLTDRNGNMEWRNICARCIEHMDGWRPVCEACLA